MSSLSPKYRSFRKQLQARFKPAACSGNSSPLPAIINVLGSVNQGANTHRPLLDQLSDNGPIDAAKLQLGPEEASVLAWVDEAFRILLQDYPLDSNLAAKIQNLRPLVAALALSEDDFHKLGEHPLQQWIDHIYQDCMSWHRGLGRSGDSLLEEIGRCEAEFSDYFTNREHKFEDLVAGFKSFLATEKINAGRMQERIITAELGKLQAAGARQQAGMALNEMMSEYKFSDGVNNFLTGPWYDSMQLTLITLGVDSQPWKRMLAITEKVVWSTQPFDASDTERRQQMYRTIPQIPRELRKLLLSLKNDDTAMELAIALIEDAHYKLLRAPAPTVKTFEPIQLGPTGANTQVSSQLLSEVSELELGQWFTVKTEDGKIIRVKLALKLDEYKQLMFVNRNGVKCLQKFFEEFAYLMSSGAARPLHSTTAFTESLRQAAGLVADEEIPESEVDLLETEIEAEPALVPKLDSVSQPEAEWLAPPPASEPAEEPEPESLSHLELEPLDEAPFQSASKPADPESETPTGADLEPLLEPLAEAEPEPFAAPALESLELEPLNAPGLESLAESEPAPLIEPELEPLAESEPAPLIEPELEPLAESEPAPLAALALEPLTESGLEPMAEPDPLPEPASAVAAMVTTTNSADNLEIEIGSWVRFSDTQSEQLCKLAARIDSIDRLLFVNARGVKQRELNHATLKALLDAGLCEVIEGGAPFQETISQMVRSFRRVDIDEDEQ